MQLSPLRTTLVATFTTVCLLFATWILLRSDGPLLSYANFEYEVISPNADNIYDVTRVTYKLSQPANVSIFFLDNDGKWIPKWHQQSKQGYQERHLQRGRPNMLNMCGNRCPRIFEKRVSNQKCGHV